MLDYTDLFYSNNYERNDNTNVFPTTRIDLGTRCIAKSKGQADKCSKLTKSNKIKIKQKGNGKIDLYSRCISCGFERF